MMQPKKMNIRMPVATTFSLKMERKPGSLRFSRDFFGLPIFFAILDVK